MAVEKLIDQQQIQSHTYDEIYAQGSSRLANEGLVGMRYRLPKIFSLLYTRYRNIKNLNILEIGAGVGELANMAFQSDLDIESYVCVEYSFPAVQHMAKMLPSAQMNAEELAFPDNSFDLVFCADLMHHVANPRKMAHEMVRVTRKHFFLSESNGLSPVRKLGEISEKAKALGEKSYFPWEYRSFFPQDQVSNLELKPFYIMVPPHTPEPWIPYVMHFSELSEHIPGFRWIGQSIMIAGEKQ